MSHSMITKPLIHFICNHLLLPHWVLASNELRSTDSSQFIHCAGSPSLRSLLALRIELVFCFAPHFQSLQFIISYIKLRSISHRHAWSEAFSISLLDRVQWKAIRLISVLLLLSNLQSLVRHRAVASLSLCHGWYCDFCSAKLDSPVLHENVSRQHHIQETSQFL